MPLLPRPRPRATKVVTLYCIAIFIQIWSGNLSQSGYEFQKGNSTTLTSEKKKLVIRDRASNMAGDPAPCAELDPTSS